MKDFFQYKGNHQTMRVFEEHESQVRSYVRAFPAVFDTAEGSHLQDENGKRYIDFFAGAGTLNYGHNHPAIRRAMMDYLEKGGVLHSLDKATTAKRAFMETFHDLILAPRGYQYKIQFPGPTGTNAVETALKLARMVKRRSNIIAFTNGFHGLTMGSLAVTGNDFYRDESFGARSNVDHLPFDGYFGPDVDTITYLRKMLADHSSGIDLPAAIIVETIQAEGGVNVASARWLKALEETCREFDVLLIVDDIQVGNGRTGAFFSFEEADVTPDIITLSKSIGGGLPLSLMLMRPELDQWKPGEHTGTFRGNNLAFIAAATALETYWKDEELCTTVRAKGDLMENKLNEIAGKYPGMKMTARGRGMMWGLEIPEPGIAGEISRLAFRAGLIIELSGAEDQVVKFLPPLVIEEETLREGIDIVDRCIGEITKRRAKNGVDNAA